MTPNPTLRPFVAGALLFLALLGFWPSHAGTPTGAGSRSVPVSADVSAARR